MDRSNSTVRAFINDLAKATARVWKCLCKRYSQEAIQKANRFENGCGAVLI